MGRDVALRGGLIFHDNADISPKNARNLTLLPPPTYSERTMAKAPMHCRKELSSCMKGKGTKTSRRAKASRCMKAYQRCRR